VVKKIFAVVSFVVAVSCNPNTAETQNNDLLKQRVSTLESRVDSLLNSLATDKPEKTTNSKKKKVKRNVPVADQNDLPVSEYESAGTGQKLIIQKQTITEKTSYSGQCGATTKKGGRCKRSVRSGGYCWQHGG